MIERKKYVVVVCPNPAIDILASVDKFEVGVPNRLTKEERYPGGKGLHVAMALAEYGIEVVVVGFWGSVSGEWIKSEANRYYPSIRFDGPSLADWARSCYTFKSSDGFDDTEILGTGPVITAENFNSLLNVVNSYLEGAASIAISGSWPKGVHDKACHELVLAAKEMNVPSFVDCTGPQLENALTARPYCVHLNRKEITGFFNAGFEVAQKELLKSCDLAAITDGSKGLYLSNSERTVHALSEVQKVISTIGSGDCLLAGIVAAHFEGQSFEMMARMGAAFGAANCLRSELGMLHKKDILELLSSPVEHSQ